MTLWNFKVWEAMVKTSTVQTNIFFFWRRDPLLEGSSILNLQSQSFFRFYFEITCKKQQPINCWWILLYSEVRLDFYSTKMFFSRKKSWSWPRPFTSLLILYSHLIFSITRNKENTTILTSLLDFTSDLYYPSLYVLNEWFSFKSMFSGL